MRIGRIRRHSTCFDQWPAESRTVGYIFAVLALEAERIEIDKEATPALLMFNLFNGTLGRAFLEGWYER
jgi:phosphatidylethanolamine-binding protein (PEBP) family uncharacterized protein